MLREMIRSVIGASLAVVLMITGSGVMAQTNSAPDFKEVYELLREHLAGVNETDLNRAAVEGLVSALSPRVQWSEPGSASVAEGSGKLLSVTNVIEGGIGFIRVVRVADGLASAIKSAIAGFDTANKLRGIVLDLRYAGGEDYAAAAAAGDLYVARERVMLDWGKGPVSSKEKDDAVIIPTVVLINGQSGGAAEALAAVLREMGSALLVGKRTAGKAVMAHEYSLKDGSKLRIATGNVRVGENTSLTSEGITPDIEVDVPAQSERAYYLNPFYAPGQAGSLAVVGASAAASRTGSGGTTNRPVRRPRLTEAELVRERQAGTNRETAPVETEAEGPVVRDPSLARALDLLKGLAVVRSQRP
jgi:hypothetical protein